MLRGLGKRPLLWGLALGAVLLLAGSGCRGGAGGVCLLGPAVLCFPGSGAYPTDLFSEMHYQQFYRSQEPPRLTPPEGAVPFGGREVPRTSEEYRGLTNPLHRTDDGLKRAGELFRVNCATCHGAGGRGDGPAGGFLVRDGYSRPPDLTAAQTQNRTDGEIFGLISEGVFVMPRFRLLLPEEDRWLLVHYIRSLQGR